MNGPLPHEDATADLKMCEGLENGRCARREEVGGRIAEDAGVERGELAA